MSTVLAKLSGSARFENEIVAIRGAETLRLGQLRAEIAHNSRRLVERRVKRGMVVCEDSFQFVVGLMALLQAGAEVVLPPNAQPGTLSSFADLTDLLVTDLSRDGHPNAFVLESAGASGGAVPAAAAQIRISFFTSGSTGQPKRVEKSLEMLEFEAMALDATWGSTLGPARIVGMVSHQHIFGLAFKVMWPLVSGRPFSTQIHHTWETLVGELSGPTAIVSSPAHLTRIGGLTPLAAENCPRMIFSAGAPLPTAAAREIQEILGTAATEIFGSTETGAVAWRNGPGEDDMWRPLSGVETSSTNDGLLRVRSPFASSADWCDLADRVELAADGRFRFQGRADRIAKIEGKRVSLPQLERELTQLPWVSDAAVVIVPPKLSFLGAVVVLTRLGREEFTRQGKFRFERMLRGELASTQDAAVLPRRWRFVDRIPMDGMGKRLSGEVTVLLTGS